VKRRRTFACAHCGAEVRATAKACPECGSDERTGWSGDAEAWSGDPPTGYGADEDFDYDEVLRAEGLAGRPSRERVRRRRNAIVVVLLGVGFLLLWWAGR
jgi:hypothetical protein